MNTTSSAYSPTLFETYKGRSLMKIRKSKGAKTVPCSASEKTLHELRTLFII